MISYLALGWPPGIGEVVLILAVVLVLFGAKKLPELARSMGSSINEFKRGLKEEPDSELPEGSDSKKGDD